MDGVCGRQRIEPFLESLDRDVQGLIEQTRQGWPLLRIDLHDALPRMVFMSYFCRAAYNNSRAFSQSLRIVRVVTPRDSAICSTVKPAKYRISTTWTNLGSRAASSCSASSTCMICSSLTAMESRISVPRVT